LFVVSPLVKILNNFKLLKAKNIILQEKANKFTKKHKSDSSYESSYEGS